MSKVQINVRSKLLIIFLILSLACKTIASCIDESKEISVLTLRPGDELYSLFGHTAIRIIDHKNHTDYVYNFGMFDFEERNFYLKFIKGNLKYYLARYEYEYVQYEAFTYKRTLFEQKLRLSDSVTLELSSYLDFLARINYNYPYEFFEFNCATVVAELIDSINNNSIKFNFARFPEKASYRDLINPYIQHRPFVKAGINFLLGPAADKIIGYKDYFFLPDYIMLGLEGAVISDGEDKFLSGKPVVMYESHRFSDKKNTDVLIATIFLIIVLCITIEEFRYNRHFFKIDYVAILLSGVFGILLLFLWIWSDHVELHKNLNLLWASPLNFILFFFVSKNNSAYSVVFMLACIVLFFTGYFTGFQFVPFSVVLLVLSFFVRLFSFLYHRHLKFIR